MKGGGESYCSLFLKVYRFYSTLIENISFLLSIFVPIFHFFVLNIYYLSPVSVLMTSSFKYKPTKKIILDEKSITTLDSKHKEIQSGYQYTQDIIIPGLQKEKSELKNKLLLMKQSLINNNHFNSNGITTTTAQSVTTIDEIMEIRDRIKEITNTIKKHEQT